MIGATVSSWSCFCWPYRASASFAVENIINLISVLAIWWCPCVESCVVGRVCLLWSVCSLGKILLAFALLYFVLQGKICLLLQISLDFLLLRSSPLWWKGLFFFFCLLVLEGLVGLHRTIQLQLLQHYWLGHRLGYCDIEWFALEMNRVHSVIFETAPKYCILDSFVDCDGHSISSKWFLPTVIDIMAIWIKFAHSSPF